MSKYQMFEEELMNLVSQLSNILREEDTRSTFHHNYELAEYISNRLITDDQLEADYINRQLYKVMSEWSGGKGQELISMCMEEIDGIDKSYIDEGFEEKKEELLDRLNKDN